MPAKPSPAARLRLLDRYLVELGGWLVLALTGSVLAMLAFVLAPPFVDWIIRGLLAVALLVGPFILWRRKHLQIEALEEKLATRQRIRIKMTRGAYARQTPYHREVCIESREVEIVNPSGRNARIGFRLARFGLGGEKDTTYSPAPTSRRLEFDIGPDSFKRVDLRWGLRVSDEECAELELKGVHAVIHAVNLMDPDSKPIEITGPGEAVL